MKLTSAIYVVTAMLSVSATASATTYTATSANFSSVFYNAKAGDRIVLSGSFGALQLRDRSFSTAINIDARKAVFNDSLLLKNVSGVNFIYGTFGSTTGTTRYGQAVVINGGSNINFNGSKFVGNGGGMGLTFTNTDDVNVTRSTFTSLSRGLAFTGVTNGLMKGNKFINSSSDGAAIVDSHFVTATRNSCSGTAPSTGAHPDCIQLWSIAGNPVQSDITLSYNTAIGTTQGFTSFTPQNGGGLRITMISNIVSVNYPQAIACYGCVDSLFANNVVRTLPGASHQARINIVGGENNIEFNNSVGAFDRNNIGTPLSAEALAMLQGSMAGVPEPDTWLQMIVGMMAVGWAIRRRDRLTLTVAN